MATHVEESREKVVLLFVEALGVRNHIVDEEQRPVCLLFRIAHDLLDDGRLPRCVQVGLRQVQVGVRVVEHERF